MAVDPIAARYAQAFFEAAKAENRLAEAAEQLQRIGGMMRDYPELSKLLISPDVEPEKKVDVVAKALHGEWSDLLKAFVHMVVAMGRAAELPGIVDAFQAAVDAYAGRMRVLVRSARPLPEAVLKRLRARLEKTERKQIELSTEVDPALLGGLEIRLDHRIIDGSVRRQLNELRQRLTTVRVS
jgi:F-type H+-transporting ATPase subunit delta